MEQLWGVSVGEGPTPAPADPARATHLQLAVLVHSEVAWLQVLEERRERAPGERQVGACPARQAQRATSPPSTQGVSLLMCTSRPRPAALRRPETPARAGSAHTISPEGPQNTATLLSLAFPIPCPRALPPPSPPGCGEPLGAGGSVADTALTLWMTPAEWMYCVGRERRGVLCAASHQAPQLRDRPPHRPGLPEAQVSPPLPSSSSHPP